MDVVMSSVSGGGAAATTTSQSTSQSTPAVTVTSPGASKKRSLLTLDLNGPTSTTAAAAGQSQTTTTTLTLPSGTLDFRPSPGFVLTSPDVQMLQLASPELEKYIIQGLMGQNTPTPTKLVFPQNVTEEQESYAKGFVDALNALHRSGMAYNVVTPGQGNAFPIGNANGQNLFPQFFTMQSNQQQFMQPQLIQQQQQPGQSQLSQQQQQPQHGTITMQLPQPTKMEPYSPSVSPAPSDPQTVPSNRGSSKSSTNSSSGTSPINMESQSKMKQERKRERNRLAAAKCRMRKLERISQLEERVKELKEQNAALSDTSLHLRTDLAGLKQELLNHMQAGCGLSLPAHVLHSLQHQPMQE